MQAIVTHSNIDFDALASLVAATFIYPDAVGLIPRQIQPTVKQFLGLHREIFRIHPAKDTNIQDISRLIVVDTNNWKRVDDGASLRRLDIPEIVLWDHHIKGRDLEAQVSVHEEMGATVTLLLREIIKRDIPFTPIHATLFLLGLYDDTGSLTYPMTRAEDARAAAFLLENGAELNVVNAFLTESFDSIQQRLLRIMLEEGETINSGGVRVGLAHLRLESSVNMLSQVVVKFRELSGADACFGIFSFYDKSFVIARSIFPAFDVGSIIKTLGGGGHAGAASAVVNDIEPDKLYGVVRGLIEEADTKIVRVGSVMYMPHLNTELNAKIRDVADALLESSERLALVMKEGSFSGIVSSAQIELAVKKGEGGLPIKTLLKDRLIRLNAGQALREAAQIMMDNDAAALPVFEGEEFKGILNRNDVLLHLYDF